MAGFTLASLGFICLLGFTHAAIDNSGTEFIICFMDNQITNSNDLDVEIFLTTASNTPASVNVTTPLFDAGWVEQLTVSRGSIQMLTIPTAIRGADVALEGKGIYVSASEEVTLYSVNKQVYSTDGFIAYPVDSLGMDHVAVTWEDKAEMMVASVTDGTSVTFTISSDYSSSFDYNGATYSAGSTLTVTLNRFQTFHIYSASGDFTGTRITATNPISAFSGNYKIKVQDSNTGTTSDHLVEQLIPTQAWGKTFIAFPSPERTVGDFVRVVASVDSTTVSVGGASTYSLNQNEYTTLNLPSDQYTYITSDYGVCVVVFSKSIGSSPDGPNGGDPAMSFVVPIPLYGSDYTWSTVTTSSGDFNNFIIIVSKSAYTNDLVLDNSAISTSWTSVTGNSDYVAAAVSVSTGAHSLYNSIPANSFLGIAYGNAQYNSYAYASGLRLASINLPCTPTSTVAADGFDNDCDGMIDEETDNGIDDDGDGLIDEDLAIPPRVDGNYTDWSAWDSCSATCGSLSGTYSRTRNCTNPAPANFGLDCVGDASETSSCTGSASPCPIDGNWSDWASWSTCSVTCGTGALSRNRTCDNPAAQYGGLDCVGDTLDTTPCNISDYCLPSMYGNILLGCGNSSFGCSTGTIQCVDIAFRCDGTVDCDDGTDESLHFAGCSINMCTKKNAAASIQLSLIPALLLPIVVAILKLQP